MSLTLAGRLFHSVGAAIWDDLSPRVFFVFPMRNCNGSSSTISTQDHRVQVDILL